MEDVVAHLQIDQLFSDISQADLGQRLGIPFMRAQLETIDITVGERRISLQQSHLGIVAISGVIWDCGLFMVDLLSSFYGSSRSTRNQRLVEALGIQELGNTLDLGCGTGVCGIAAKLIGSEYVLFTDGTDLSICRENMDVILGENLLDVDFVPYNWTELPIPEKLLRPSHATTTSGSSATNNMTCGCWDTILCSDVLYEEKCHAALMNVLKNIEFKKLFLSYKRRKDEPERKFLEYLSTWCSLYVVDPSDITLNNLPKASLQGLTIIIAVPKQ